VRVKVRLEVRDIETGRAHILHTSDLSVGGARCMALGPVRAEAVLEGFIYLPLSEAGRDTDVALPVRGRVLRLASPDNAPAMEFAVAFDAMKDADRAELSAYLFDWLANDSWSHAGLTAEAIS
jgi:hypothetical protein